MEPTKPTPTPAKSGKDKASFRDTFNQLTFFTLVGSAIVVFTPLAPGVRPFVPETLFYTLFTWSLITGLPMAWKRRSEWLPKWRSFWLSLRKGSQAVGTLIPSIPLPDLAGTGGETPKMNHSVPLMAQLPAPFHLLPVNPKFKVNNTLTKEAAAKKVGDALQLSGISFEGQIEVLEIEPGPTIVGINFRLPEKVQASMITRKRDDIANHMGCSKTLSIKPAEKYQSAICFVIPNSDRSYVYMRDVIPEFLQVAQSGGVPIILGKDMQGNALIFDLTKFPHLLLAGTTGSGKSVQINTMIQSIVMYNSPEVVKLILIDPKRVELEPYNGYPHLLMPIVTNPRRAPLVLNKLCEEMDLRYDLFASDRVRNIVQYNEKAKEPLPYIVIFIDEFADLMVLAGASVEDAIQRLTQLARAAGIHLVVGTQRPSVDVITGIIKANLPTRMAFAMQSQHDYRTVMDKNGPLLLGKGDGVFVFNAGSEYRFQSAAISVDDNETSRLIEQVKDYWNQKQSNPSGRQPIRIEKDDDSEEGQGQMELNIEAPSSSIPEEVPVPVISAPVVPESVTVDEPIVEVEPEPNHEAEAPPMSKPVNYESHQKHLLHVDGAEQLPAPFHLLPVNPKPKSNATLTEEEAAQKVESALQLSGISFEDEIEIINIESGPTLQGINFRLPKKVQASTISKKRDDIANHLGLSKTFSIASVPGQRSAVSFIVPNPDRSYVYMRDIIPEFLKVASTMQIPIILGREVHGTPLIADLTEFPHLLIAGSTGSGKSVQINTIIESIVMYQPPTRVQLILIDPKKVELDTYNGYPHLRMPIVTNVEEAAAVLQNICLEMDKRYELFVKHKVRNILQYNKSAEEYLPYLVVIVEEYADLMILAREEVEDAMQRLTQLARAAGIHLITGTQRPSTDIVTGTIKANLPTRMAFAMKSPHDYRTVMDQNGPPLLGKGDGMFMLNAGAEYRFQSATISVDDDEMTQLIENVKQYWIEYQQSSQNPQHKEDHSISKPVTNKIEPPKKHPEINPATAQVSGIDWSIQNDIVYPDNTYATALDIAKEYGGISVDILKLNMGIDFDQATKYMGMMHETGLLGEFVDGKREYVGNVANKLSDEELAEQVKRQIMTTGKVSSEALAKHFTIQKAKMITILKQLAEDGVLNRPEVNGSSYTIGWTQEEIENYLHDRPYNEMPY